MLNIALAQINPTVGALSANAEKIIEYAQKAKQQQADLVLFPELALCGYPPEDLLYSNNFLQQCEQMIKKISQSVPQGLWVIFGAPIWKNKHCFNAAVVVHDGKIIVNYAKQYLPNYGVFDEKRYFTPGNQTEILKIKDTNCAITICEDLWHKGPAEQAKKAGADLLLNLNASPYHEKKHQQRLEVMSKRAKENQLSLLYVNQIGGQDELVFDGASFVLNDKGERLSQSPKFIEDLSIVNLSTAKPDEKSISERSDELADIYSALVLGVKDYVVKNHFSKVILGLSGGIDSALTLSIAVDALGAEAVEVLMMPSRYNLEISLIDAKKQADTLKVRQHVVPIEPMFQSFLSSVEFLKNKKSDVTEENIQARIRGLILMARSNQTNAMLLTTGNKSEMSVGYATLYGDMAGGFAPLKDVYKTLVYELASWLNRYQEVIPNRVIVRAPSAELSDNQKDSDSLPDYDILDKILKLYIEEELGVSEIIATGLNEKVSKRIVQMVNRNEYKRQQSAPGVIITSKAYGKDRRYPIVNEFICS